MFSPLGELPRLGWPAKLTGVLILWTLLLGAVFGYVTQTVMSQLRQTHQLVAELREQVAGSPSGTELAVAGAITQMKSLSSLRGAGDEAPYLPQAHPRRLGYAIFGNVKSNGEALDSNTGCVYITASTTIDLSTKACGTNSHRCPFCFICAHDTGAAITLQLNNCAGAYYSDSKQISSDSAKMMVEITVINSADPNACVVKYDGATTADSVAKTRSTTFLCLSTDLNTALTATGTSVTTDKLYFNPDR